MSAQTLYDDLKAAQTTGLLLELNGGKENLLKLIKLLYAIERESIKRWSRPFTYDTLVSMPHGQVVSHTYDHIKTGVWGDCFKTIQKDGGKTVHLLRECGVGKLSRADISLIAEIYQIIKDKSPDDLEREHHDPECCQSAIWDTFKPYAWGLIKQCWQAPSDLGCSSCGG